jgi:hypothetical protein
VEWEESGEESSRESPRACLIESCYSATAAARRTLFFFCCCSAWRARVLSLICYFFKKKSHLRETLRIYSFDVLWNFFVSLQGIIRSFY